MERRKALLALGGAYLILSLFGLLMVFSASCVIAQETMGTPYFYLKRQVLYLLLSMGLVLTVVSYVNTETIRRCVPLILILSIVSLVLPFIPKLGYEAGGAKRWVRIFGFSVQPSEFAKLAFAVYLSHYISRNRKKILPPLIFLSVISILLALEPDVGSTIFLSLFTFISLFTWKYDTRKIVAILLISLAIFLLLVKSSSYRTARIMAFLSPWKHRKTCGYQVVQSFISFGSGGLLGKGLGKGTEKLFYLPDPHTDFIFAVIGEELGFMGVLFTVSMYAIVFFSGIKLSSLQTDGFKKVLIMSLVLMITLQALIHMGVNLGLLPPKGITLPFVSYGGSSLLSSSIAIGLILRAGMDE